MRIYLLRHGETDWNLQKKMQGTHDIPLNETGMAQADASGAALEGITVSFIVSSDMIRARQTAGIVASHLGVHDLRTEHDLMERSYGDLEGQYIPDVAKYVDTDRTVETIEHVGTRVMGVLERLAAEATGDFLVVSHGGAIMSVLNRVSGGKIGSVGTSLKNACINILNCDDGRFSIEAYNLTVEEYRERFGK